MKHGRFTPVLILFAAATARADDKDKPTYHERLEYDAAKGQWIEIAPPIPGTEDGDLALARSLLASANTRPARPRGMAEMYRNPLSARGPLYAAETEVSAGDAKLKSGI
jgi:hypothetical protein